jgi:hypothetical protein
MSKTILHIGGIPLSIGKIPICLDYTPPIDYGPLLLQFVTNDVGGSSFDPSVATSSGTLWWDLGDGSILNSNKFTHVYSLSGNKTVKVYQGSTTGSVGILEIGIDNDKIVGVLDLSTLSNLGGVFDANTNPDLTQIKNPISSQIFAAYYAYNCNLTGTLDLSALSNLGGSIQLFGNPNLTQILNPTSSRIITSYCAYNCNLDGTLNVSGLSQLGGNFQVNNNPNLQHILNPISTRAFSTYYAHDCDLRGALDVSSLTGLGGQFQVRNNTRLKNILFPTSSQVFTYISAQDCSLEGIVDLRGLSNLGGAIEFQNNRGITEIKNPTSSQTITFYRAYSCNLTGALDVSGLTGLGGQFQVQANPLLTQIKFPTSSTKFTGFTIEDCSLAGTLDVSGLLGFGGIVQMKNNTNLTSFILPSTLTHQLISIDARNCALDKTSVDNIFTKLRILWDSSLPSQNSVIYLHQGTNAAPTGNYSNTDIVKIYNIFDNSTLYDVSIVINTEIEQPLLQFITEASTFDPTFIVNPYSPEATALFNRMAIQPSTALKQLIDKTITDLKTAGIWQITDKFHKWDLHTEQASLLDWKNPAFDATCDGSPYFIPKYGVATISNESYINLNFIPAIDCQYASLNDMGFALDDLTGGYTPGPNFGSYDKANTTMLGFRTMEVGAKSPWLWFNTKSQRVWNSSGGINLYYNDRPNATDQRIYKSPTNSILGANTSVAMTDNNIILGGYVASSSVVLKNSINTSIFWLGKSFTDEQRTAWYNIMDYWKANIGAANYLGEEIISNEADRAFTSDTGWWIKGADWTIGGGAAASTSSSTYLLSPQIFQVGKVYEISYTILSGSVGSLNYGGTGYIFQPSVTGDYKTFFKGNVLARLGLYGIGSITNISVKEVLV